MQIGPKTTEKTIRLIADAEKMAKEITSKEAAVEGATAELPRMSLESVMPKQNIVIRSVQKAATEEFDVMKAIKEFHDINDTETIKKICRAWQADLSKIEEQFISGRIPEKEVYKEHRMAIEDLNKYGVFSNKVFEATFINPAQNKRAMEIFEKHIEPIIMQSQETMRTVDNLPSVKKAYKEAAKEAAATVGKAEPAKVVTTTNEKQDAAKVSTGATTSSKKTAAQKTPIATPTEDKVAAEILKSIKSVNDMNGVSKIIFQIEKNRSSMSPDKYAELNDLIVSKMQSL